MNYNEQQILELAVDVLRKIDFQFDTATPLKVDFMENGGLNLPPEPNVDVWKVSVQFYDEHWGKNKLAVLYISDETGKPLQIQTSMTNVYNITDEDLID